MAKSKEDIKILIVDDEEALRKNMTMRLKLRGYQTFACASGNEAYEVFLEEKIDFVITDIRMPDGDGVDLLTKIRKNHPKVPIVVMVTGFAEITKDEAVEKGALDLLAKPIDFKKIESYIESELSI